MLKIILATRNNGKLQEIKNKLKEYPIALESLKNYPEIPEIQETGKTFSENALIKARTVARWTNLTAIADDSGLEIDFLDKKPGIYSARWGKTDQQRIEKAIKALQNTKKEQRIARFICVMGMVIPETNEQKYFLTEGICPGKIALNPQGSAGFGYDPIFIPDGYDKTFAQLGEDVKNVISHRAIALDKMIQIIVEYFKLNK
jgi:XTP/dITP diphosphohydrolase